MSQQFEVVVTLFRMTTAGKLAARANVDINFDSHGLTLHGFRVIKEDGKAPWVAPPQFEYMKDGKKNYKNALGMTTDLRNLVAKAVLDEFLKN